MAHEEYGGAYSGQQIDEAIALVFSGNAGGEVTDHQQLSNRDSASAHPISSIEGLEEALARIPLPMTAEELRKILMN